MSLIDDLKAKADQNGDGKINKEDLEALKGDENNDNDTLDKLKEVADQNEDGKLSFEDVKNFDLGGTVDDIKGMFGK